MVNSPNSAWGTATWRFSNSGDICIFRWPSLEFQRIPQEEAAGFRAVALEAYSCWNQRLGSLEPQNSREIKKVKGRQEPYHQSPVLFPCLQASIPQGMKNSVLVAQISGQANEPGLPGQTDGDYLPLGKGNSGHQAERCQKI